MKKNLFSTVFLAALCGIIAVCCGGCKKHESARLTINVEGKELSDAFILVDDCPAGSLTQTAVRPDGRIYINGVFAAKTSENMSDQEATIYSGCSDSISIPSGRHTITLGKGKAKTLQVVVDVLHGHHLLIYHSGQDLVKWDNKSFQVGLNGKVIASPE